MVSSNDMSRCVPSPTEEIVSCSWLRIFILSVPHSTHECEVSSDELNGSVNIR